MKLIDIGFRKFFGYWMCLVFLSIFDQIDNNINQLQKQMYQKRAWDKSVIVPDFAMEVFTAKAVKFL